MDLSLTEALELARQEPGRAYEAVDNGDLVEVRVKGPAEAVKTPGRGVESDANGGPPESAAEDDSSEYDGPPYLIPWFEIPDLSPSFVVRAAPGPIIWPDPPIVPPDDPIE